MGAAEVTAAELLEQARAEYVQAAAGYRDTLLSVGRRLHDYLLAWLAQAPVSPEAHFVQHRFTREEGVRQAAKSLRCSGERINSLIVAAMALELLGDGSPLGNIAHHSITIFRVFLVRENQGTGDDRPQSYAAYETWLLRPESAEKARSIFRRMVAEQWSVKRVHKEIDFQRATRPRRLPVPQKTNQFQLVAASMKHASPGDVAASCLALLQSAGDPAAVAVRLRVMLEQYLPKPKRAKRNAIAV